MDYKSFFKNVISTISTQGFLMIINFILSVLTTRWLGACAKGEYSVATTIYLTGVQFGILGLHSAHVFYLAKDKKNMRYVLGNSIFISVVLGGIIAMGIIVYSKLFPNVIVLSNKLILLSASMIPIQLLWSLQGQTLIAVGKVNEKNMLDLVNVISLLLITVLIYCFANLSTSSLIVVSEIIIIIINIYSIFNICISEKIIPYISFPFFKMTLPYGIKAHIACLLAYLVLRVDIFMVNSTLGNTEVGKYSLAVGIADLLSIVSSAVTTILFPTAVACENEYDRVIGVKKVVRIVSIALLFPTILLAILSNWFIPILYGEDYIDSIIPFIILLPGVVAWGIESIYAIFFASVKSFKYSLITTTITFFVNVFLNSCLLGRYGIKGAAVASTISYIFALICMIASFHMYIRKNNNNESEEIENI